VAAASDGGGGTGGAASGIRAAAARIARYRTQAAATGKEQRMHRIHLDAATHELAGTAPIDRKTALTFLGSCFAVFAGAVTRRTAVRAQDGGVCVAFHYNKIAFKYASTADGKTWHVRLQLTADGRVAGAIRQRDEAGITTFLPVPDSAVVSCSDRNGNGIAGLTELAFDVLDAGTRNRVSVVLATREGQDIDQSGFGFVTFQVGEDPSFETEARITLVRRRRRRQRRRRGNR
jgi:hypothetical protein